MHQRPQVKFYAVERATGRRRLFKFYVENLTDARKALKRFGVPAGWYHDEYGNEQKITAY
jgi:hypothetical protein